MTNIICIIATKNKKKSSPRMTEKKDALLRWLLEGDSGNFKISDSIEVRETAFSGRGIYTHKDISAPTTIIKIPPSKLLNFTTAVAHIVSWNNGSKTLPEEYRGIKAPQPKDKRQDKITEFYKSIEYHELSALTSFQLLGMYLSLEKLRGKDSYWFFFIDMLPSMEDFELVPLIWKIRGDNEYCNLLPNTAKRIADSMLSKFEHDYEVVSQFLRDHAASFSIPKSDFLQSWMCINSRCLYMDMPQSKTNDDNFTMAPYVDFLNHSPDEQCILKINSLGFEVRTTKQYRAGEEIYLSYGAHSNEFLLCEYGFTLPENPWNDVDITEEIVSGMSANVVSFLKDISYYGEYTLNKEDLSFRSEIAFAAIEETDTDLQSNRRLRAFINGVTDGALYRRRIQRRLTLILGKIKVNYTKKLNSLTQSNDPILGVIATLYRDKLKIIDYHLQIHGNAANT